MGLAESASLLFVNKKAGVRLPWKSQYLMKPEAEEGISKIIEVLLKAGVLVVVTHPASSSQGRQVKMEISA